MVLCIMFVASRGLEEQRSKTQLPRWDTRQMRKWATVQSFVFASTLCRTGTAGFLAFPESKSAQINILSPLKYWIRIPYLLLIFLPTFSILSKSSLRSGFLPWKDIRINEQSLSEAWNSSVNLLSLASITFYLPAASTRHIPCCKIRILIPTTQPFTLILQLSLSLSSRW